MSASPLSRVGFTARELLSARMVGPRRIWPLHVGRMRAAQANRLPWVCAAPLTTRSERQSSPKLEMARRLKASGAEVASQALSMLLPGTFILPPLSQFPKSFGDKVRFMLQWLVMKAQVTFTNLALRYTSKPNFFQGARFKPKRATLIPTAKALHRSLAQALAVGDKDMINRICTRDLASSVMASIDARPRNRRYGWELVGYTKKLVYPTIRSHRLSPLSKERYAPIIRQVVVAISSKQRRVVYDAQGQVVPGSEKEMDVVENVAFGCIVDPKTWEQTEWRLIGTIKPTTYEGWVEEKAMLKVLMQN